MSTSKDFFEVTSDALDVGEVSSRVASADCGVIVVLCSCVRMRKRGDETRHIIYEADEATAVPEMRALGEKVRDYFDIGAVGIVHRLGKIGVGDVGVVIAVAAPHRKGALGACEWLMGQLKRTVSSKKKEVYFDSSTKPKPENGPMKKSGTGEDPPRSPGTDPQRRNLL
jgi:molybdopterin synthase catalytic subunit